METLLIVGLGNPGSRYEHTRHNVGFDTVDLIADRLSIHHAKEKLRAMVAEGQYMGRRVALVKPSTYMNDSGLAVSALMKWYHAEPKDILIISDDIDLAPGSLRLRPHGGAGTHNGWRSIIAETGSDRFPRIRVGVGAPPPKWDLADWVLSRVPGSPDAAKIEKTLELAADAALCFLSDGIDTAMNRYNRKQNEPDV